MVGDSNDKTNFPHKLLLINAQISRICKTFTNGSSANIKFSKTQLSKMMHSGSFIFEMIDPFKIVVDPLGIMSSSIYAVKM